MCFISFIYFSISSEKRLEKNNYYSYKGGCLNVWCIEYVIDG